MGARVASFVGAVVVAVGVTALPPPLAHPHVGAWQTTPPVTPRLAPELTPAERTAATAVVNQLLDVIRRMPSTAGFQLVPHAAVDIENLDHSDGTRVACVTTDVTVNLVPQAGRGAAPNEQDAAGHVEIKVNDLQPLIGSETGLSDDQGAFIQNPPEPVDTRHGYPVFAEGNGDRWIMIRRNDVPFVAPVTAERYMLATIAVAERQLAEARDRRAKVPAGVPASILATIDEAIAGFQRRVTNDRQALSAMSPAQRAAPARVLDGSSDEPPRFAPADDTSTPAVVYFNPALMAPGLPRTRAQILAVGIGASDRFPDLAAKLDRELDWAALDTFVHQSSAMTSARAVSITISPPTARTTRTRLLLPDAWNHRFFMGGGGGFAGGLVSSSDRMPATLQSSPWRTPRPSICPRPRTLQAQSWPPATDAARRRRRPRVPSPTGAS